MQSIIHHSYSFGAVATLVFSVGFVLLFVGFMIGLNYNRHARQRNRQFYDSGNISEILENPEKTKTKCGFPFCGGNFPLKEAENGKAT